ncbi:NAD(P)H-binding protein [Roseobacter weihaiensis]|uniref:NAD(P)H-binding protein n=1 Tax=Roseobacter weihaiensis TaxID=2763262 RepID=UPI001D0A801E
MGSTPSSLPLPVHPVTRTPLNTALSNSGPGGGCHGYSTLPSCERAVRARSLAWTILRPGSVDNGQGSGFIKLRDTPGESVVIARADVATWKRS